MVTFWAQRNEEKQKKRTKQMRFPQWQAAGFRARAERDRGRPLSAAACGGLRESRHGRHASGFFSRFVMSVPCFGRFQRGEFRVRSRLASSWSFVFDAK